jgi:hypothetical protein
MIRFVLYVALLTMESSAAALGEAVAGRVLRRALRSSELELFTDDNIGHIASYLPDREAFDAVLLSRSETLLPTIQRLIVESGFRDGSQVIEQLWAIHQAEIIAAKRVDPDRDFPVELINSIVTDRLHYWCYLPEFFRRPAEYNRRFSPGPLYQIIEGTAQDLQKEYLQLYRDFTGDTNLSVTYTADGRFLTVLGCSASLKSYFTHYVDPESGKSISYTEAGRFTVFPKWRVAFDWTGLYFPGKAIHPVFRADHGVEFYYSPNLGVQVRASTGASPRRLNFSLSKDEATGRVTMTEPVADTDSMITFRYGHRDYRQQQALLTPIEREGAVIGYRLGCYDRKNLIEEVKRLFKSDMRWHSEIRKAHLPPGAGWLVEYEMSKRFPNKPTRPRQLLVDCLMKMVAMREHVKALPMIYELIDYAPASYSRFGVSSLMRGIIVGEDGYLPDETDPERLAFLERAVSTVQAIAATQDVPLDEDLLSRY